MVAVVELVRNPNEVTGRVVRREAFNSWRGAWRYFEGDLLYDKRCPLTKVIRVGKNIGVIQHWALGRDHPDCECKELVEERFNEEFEEGKPL